MHLNPDPGETDSGLPDRSEISNADLTPGDPSEAAKSQPGEKDGDKDSASTLPATVQPYPRRLSQILLELAARTSGPISIADIREALGDRSFAALLVFFAALNLLPLPPGTTLVLGPPLIIVSIQMVLGSQSAWLPKRVLERTISPESLGRLARRIVPPLRRLEQLVRPRNWPFPADRVIGMITLILAVAITLPIPLGNWLPALATALIGLALSERDGVFLMAGLLTAGLSIGVIAMVVSAAGVLANAVLGIHF